MTVTELTLRSYPQMCVYNAQISLKESLTTSKLDLIAIIPLLFVTFGMERKNYMVDHLSKLTVAFNNLASNLQRVGYNSSDLIITGKHSKED